MNEKNNRAIVVATSDRGMEDSLRMKFKEKNLQVYFVRRNNEAILEVLDRDVDLLIVDIDMTGGVGIDILPVIRRLCPRLPVILISEDFTYRIRKTAAEQGVTYQSVKPRSALETNDVVSITEKIVARKELMQVN
ncbi:response regulator [candidate division KSB1 bacterium]|nr:response regulator [candidate division KSB1 bacterium]